LPKDQILLGSVDVDLVSDDLDRKMIHVAWRWAKDAHAAQVEGGAVTRIAEPTLFSAACLWIRKHKAFTPRD
jgi:hypothetical protein